MLGRIFTVISVVMLAVVALVVGYAIGIREGIRPEPVADGQPWQCWTIHRAVEPDSLICCRLIDGVVHCRED